MRSVDVSLIFVYRNTPKEISNAIKSIKEACGKYSYEIIIVDNGSTEKVPEKVFEIEKITYLKNKNVGYGVGLNKGSEKAKGRFLLFSNPDLIFAKKSIKKLIERMSQDSSVGIIGPAFKDEKNKIRNVGSGMPFFPDVIFALSSVNKLFPNNYYSSKYFMKNFDRKNEKEIPVLCGACMMISRNFFNKIGRFDKRFFMYFEEADICYRVAKKGFKVLYFPSSSVVHFEGRSTRDLKWIQNTFEKSRLEFLRKYYGKSLGTFFEIIIRAINLPARFI